MKDTNKDNSVRELYCKSERFGDLDEEALLERIYEDSKDW